VDELVWNVRYVVMDGLVSSSNQQPKVTLKTATSFGNAVGFEFISHIIIPGYISILLFGMCGRCAPVPWKHAGKQNVQGTFVFFNPISSQQKRLWVVKSINVQVNACL